VERKELLVDADPAVVALLGLLEPVLVLGHLLGVGERDAVDALERVVLGVAHKVGRRGFGDREGLDLGRVGDVRAGAEVDERAAAVDGRRGAVRDLGLDEVSLVFVVLR
jgi:hypothetical protein